jgi:hypothetical protein
VAYSVLGRHLMRDVTIALMAMLVATTSGCGDERFITGESSPPGIPLESRGLAKECTSGENLECDGGGEPNAAAGPRGLVLVLWQGAYAPGERAAWGRVVDPAARRPVGRLLKLRLGLAEPGEILLIDGDRRGWTVQLRARATRVRPDGTQRPARRKPGLGLDPTVKSVGRGCGGGAISVPAGDGAPLIISAGEDRRMRIDPGVCGL